jgi:peptidyl-prolyl cis-trans isomerase D
MQIIQSIREKGAAIVIVVIALSLIGFILMDAKQGGSRLFGSFSTQVGNVNGQEIELSEFNKKVKTAEDLQEQRTGQRPGGMQTYQLREQMWNQIVAEKIFFAESKKLGIDFTAKELSYILLSNDPSNPFLQEQSLKDSITGRLDIKKAQDALNNIKKLKGEQREAVNSQIVDPLKLNKTVSKYSALLNGAAYYPSWMKEKDAADNIVFSNISFVSVPYSEISDSAVKVTDEDVNDYVNKNKDLFKQEAGRNISYVAFSQLPSKEDSAKTKEILDFIKPAFETDSNAKVFVARNSSTIDFKDEYIQKSKLSPVIADTISKLAFGSVYGPYVDNGSYILAKVLSTKQIPDSVKARHILIGVNDPQTGQQLRSDSSAKKLADSIYDAILKGADFTQMALMYSTDQGSKIKGGDLGTFAYGTMVSEFNEFCFTKTAGSKGVVKTQFGYHVIDVISQKDPKNAYKIAFLAKDIIASDLTINKASIEATKASGEKTKASLEKYVAKNGLSLTAVPGLIKENDYSVGVLQDARSLIRWVFEAKKDDVSEPFSIADQFVVAVVDKINEKGVQDAATARSGCEVIIRNKKKADIIKKKLGSNPTLESASAAYGKSIQNAGADSTLTYTSQIINGVGMEAKVIGASFNKSFQSKVSPCIEGNSGVYLIKVNSIQNKPAESPETVAANASSKLGSIRGQMNGWYEGLKKQADIEDNRSKHF